MKSQNKEEKNRAITFAFYQQVVSHSRYLKLEKRAPTRPLRGLCVMALGIGWCWDLPVVVGLALIICFEETLESSTMIAALKSELRAHSFRHSREGGNPVDTTWHNATS